MGGGRRNVGRRATRQERQGTNLGADVPQLDRVVIRGTQKEVRVCRVRAARAHVILGKGKGGGGMSGRMDKTKEGFRQPGREAGRRSAALMCSDIDSVRIR